ncbi:hypothetical protein Back2_25780 [Nocardioides baekrokdamisoli]|uniref:Peptidase MA-like domain-containing protein n=1 Tax=Nocardioides baekrokdamisoli TaxID=1804624 RepID=A0A3G9IX73_9ACTN|nr:hypothetical protein Back2_25780 [Nocardioides baekrokdamisoli]
MLLVFCAACGTHVAPPPTINSAAPSPGLAAAALTTFTDALGGRFSDVLTPAEKTAVLNAKAIGIGGVSMRYIDAATAAAPDGSWTGDVIISWRVRGEKPAEEQIGVGFTQSGGAARISSFGGAGQPVPLWLLAPVTVTRSGGVTVISEGRDPAPYLRMGLTAVQQVRETIAWPDAQLVLEVPADESTLEQMSGSAAGAYRGVAAFTGPVDGRPRGPVHIFINPDVIGTGRDAQIVLTHEATHAATNAATNPHLPAWVREGFADYVALRAQDLPLSVSADRALATVRKSGPPKTLPTDADFNSMAEDFGEEYQFAWLVWRYLGEMGGPAAATRFYDAVGAGTKVDAALRATYGGLTEAALTSQWRTYLVKLAR